MNKYFKILSIDGGGIRGVYPAAFLSELEYHLKQEGKEITKLHNYFDLICGTSTGGIIALGLALGMESKDILDLYLENCNIIFSDKKSFFSSIINSFYSNKKLEELLQLSYSKYSNNGDTRLGHAKTRVCIPVFNAFNSQVSIYKTSHHKNLRRDYQIPAYQVALSTGAAPTYFSPYTPKFQRTDSTDKIEYINNIDGGVYANNPSMIGLIEAISGLDIPLENIKLLSIGTGRKKYTENERRKNWGLWYWIKNKKLIDLIFHAQSEFIENNVKIFNEGLGGAKGKTFQYERVQFDFNSPSEYIDLDETNKERLLKLKYKAHIDFKSMGSKISDIFCNEVIEPYTPFFNL